MVLLCSGCAHQHDVKTKHITPYSLICVSITSNIHAVLKIVPEVRTRCGEKGTVAFFILSGPVAIRGVTQCSGSYQLMMYRDMTPGWGENKKMTAYPRSQWSWEGRSLKRFYPQILDHLLATSICPSVCLSVSLYVRMYVSTCVYPHSFYVCLSVCLWPLRGRACCVFLSSRSNRRAPQRKQRVSPCAPGYHERAHWARIPVAAEVMACSRAHEIPACAWFFRLRVRITAKIIWLNWSKVFFLLPHLFLSNWWGKAWQHLHFYM